MNRREFLGTMGTAIAASGRDAPQSSGSEKLHIVSLSFDHGFRRSFIRTAEIYVWPDMLDPNHNADPDHKYYYLAEGT